MGGRPIDTPTQGPACNRCLRHMEKKPQPEKPLKQAAVAAAALIWTEHHSASLLNPLEESISPRIGQLNCGTTPGDSPESSTGTRAVLRFPHLFLVGAARRFPTTGGFPLALLLSRAKEWAGWVSPGGSAGAERSVAVPAFSSTPPVSPSPPLLRSLPSFFRSRRRRRRRLQSS